MNVSTNVCMYTRTYILSIRGCNFFEELHKIGEVLEQYPGKHHVVHGYDSRVFLYREEKTKHTVNQ